jgi:hypothetical protein
MDDRELLEYAAKAVGGLVYIPEHGWIHEDANGDRGAWWDPLIDDGDAFQLAVKLRLQITPGTYNKDEFTAYYAGRAEAGEWLSALQDQYAATRRAIVRAAAAIGKGNEG